MTEFIHTYFVAFHTGNRFGSCAIRVNRPIASWEDVNALKDVMFADPELRPWVNRDDLIVLNFILLSGPDGDAR